MPLTITRMNIEDIKTYPNNAKIHTAEQIEQIKRSISEFGFNDPIAIWHGEIVEGHGRYIAAKELGFKTVDVIKLDDLTDQQRKAYALVHNKLTMNTGFDLDVLEDELQTIETDMEVYGFTDENFIDDLLEDEFGFDPAENDFFALTLTIDNQYKDDVLEYVGENGKAELVDLVIQKARGLL